MHITDYGIIAYQRIYVGSFNIWNEKGLLYTEELTPYKAINLTPLDFQYNSHIMFHNYPPFCLMQSFLNTIRTRCMWEIKCFFRKLIGTRNNRIWLFLYYNVTMMKDKTNSCKEASPSIWKMKERLHIIIYYLHVINNYGF